MKRLWSSSELRKLKSYALRGMTCREASERLKRPSPATRLKACESGIAFWTYGARR